MRLSWVCAALAAGVANALPTIEVLGNKFFDSDGKQFFMKGTALLSGGRVRSVRKLTARRRGLPVDRGCVAGRREPTGKP